MEVGCSQCSRSGCIARLNIMRYSCRCLVMSRVQRLRNRGPPRTVPIWTLRRRSRRVSLQLVECFLFLCRFSSWRNFPFSLFRSLFLPSFLFSCILLFIFRSLFSYFSSSSVCFLCPRAFLVFALDVLHLPFRRGPLHSGTCIFESFSDISVTFNSPE